MPARASRAMNATYAAPARARAGRGSRAVPQRGREPEQRQREHQYEQRREHEVRHRDAGQRERHDRVVRGAVLLHRRDHAQRHAEQHREQQRPRAQLGRHLEARNDDVAHLPLRVAVRDAELAAHGVPQEAAVLLVQRRSSP